VGEVIGTPCVASQLFMYRDIWKKEFAFSDEVIKKRKLRRRRLIGIWLKSKKGIDVSKLVMVGVHIRRTDYENHLKIFTHKGYLPIEYYYNSFNYFRER